MRLIKHLLVVLLLATVCACSGQPSESTAKTVTQAVASPAAQVDWAAMQAFWNRAMALPGIDTGPVDASKRMVVYFDPHCPVCAQQWQILRPYFQQVRIHWVPVAYMDASSAQAAAAILAAADPVAALTRNEQNFDTKINKGGYQYSDVPPQELVEQVQRNTRRAIQAGDLIGTPTLGFELLRGKRYYRMTGLLEADGARIAVADLGNTTDPWHRQRATALPAAETP